jgi:dihydrofolate synthase/folylpolyglutamate synthase
VNGRPPALDYLYSLERFGIKFGLENIRTIVETLGRPDRAFHSAHIAGTNGKGSVTAMVDAALRAAGHRSARFTSPHMLDLTERFVIDGHPVTEQALVAVIGDVRDDIAGLITAGALPAPPTFFEVTTAAALELFRRAGVEVAVIEVGLGGRLDSTNVITPRVTAITSIAFDHEQYLGHTLEAIAAEKAGIIKPHVPVVVGRVPEEARVAIENIARERDAPVVPAWEGVSARRVQPTPGQPTRIHLRTPARDYGEVMLSLRGDHQIGNAVVAVRILEQLHDGGIDVPAPAIVDGLAHVSWPGRLEHRRLPDGREMILDAAHNPAGAASLAAYLAETFAEKPPLVFAAMVDKDVRGMFEALLPAVSALVVTRSSTARSADPEALARAAISVAPHLPVRVEPTRAGALAAAWASSPRIVVAGSIFLLGDVLNEAALS